MREPPADRDPVERGDHGDLQLPRRRLQMAEVRVGAGRVVLELGQIRERLRMGVGAADRGRRAAAAPRAPPAPRTGTATRSPRRRRPAGGASCRSAGPSARPRRRRGSEAAGRDSAWRGRRSWLGLLLWARPRRAARSAAAARGRRLALRPAARPRGRGRRARASRSAPPAARTCAAGSWAPCCRAATPAPSVAPGRTGTAASSRSEPPRAGGSCWSTCRCRGRCRSSRRSPATGRGGPPPRRGR